MVEKGKSRRKESTTGTQDRSLTHVAVAAAVAGGSRAVVDWLLRWLTP
jgi:hypothetical protein